MARNYILGGMAGTQLQAGKPYFKRIVRIDGTQGQARADGLTCTIVPAGDQQGSISFSTTAVDANITVNDGKSKDWGTDGELLMVEFPTTLRSVQVQLEEATLGARAKIMLTAPGQNTKADGAAEYADPVAGGNYIEIRDGETATVSSRTKVLFILIEKYASNAIFTTAGDPAATQLTGRLAGAPADAVSILITGVLDHEPTSGGSQAANEPNSIIINTDGEPSSSLRKIWGATDGIG